MKNHLLIWGCITLIVAGADIAVQAGDYLGAEGVLQQVAAHNAKPGDQKEKDPQAEFRDELKAFSQSATNLAPAEAAKQWLDLADRAAKLQQQAGMNYVPGSQPIQFNDLLGALPPPAAWGELGKAIAARPAPKGNGEVRDIGLRLLAATLNADPDGQNREITRLSAKAKDASYQMRYQYRNYLEGISQAMLARSDNPDVVLQSLQRQVDSASADQPQQVEIPNLVAQVGAAKAEAFLRQALVAPNVRLQFGHANDTSRLAQKLALELISQLKLPQWGLVNSLDAVGLYEAMEQRFPAPTNNATLVPTPGNGALNLPVMDNGMDESQQGGAQVYYLLGLIGQGRDKDAVAVAQKMHGQNQEYEFEGAFKAMAQAGYMEALDNFFNELLTQDPTLPFWNQYVEAAAQAGHTERMVTTVRAAIARTDLGEAKKTALHEILFKALLAADQTDEAVAEMRRLMAVDDTDRPPECENSGQLGALLARIGVLLGKPEWTEEGINTAKKWLATPAGKNISDGNAENISETVAEILLELNRGPEAEALLTDGLTAATAPGIEHRSDWYGNGPPAQQFLAELALTYHKAGRPEDVLHLLENSPDWGVGDVSDLFGVTPGANLVSLMWLHTGTSPVPIPYLAADALLATGQKEQAQKITDALLDRYPGLDRGYELLLALQGTNAMARLDELFKRDQYEERPLIWKAHLLREQNQLEAAEKLLRRAIAIDPSDGEEGRGDRMRVYAELAEVRAARGDQKEADFFREVVKAIRLSEQADQFYAVGLLKHAVGMYEVGLQHFSDAYCIQSRLAIQLSALGLTEEAEEHYRRAYELMPDSFGRVESHCFGCEKVFDGERPQSIAEQVFLKLVEERPDKPQVHYLLGYLRMDEERYNEARTNFQNAVRLDPEYLNAWVNLQAVSQQILMPPKDRDAITFNILRLDPLQRHAEPDYSHVSDLPGLWNAVAAAAALQPVAATNLLALPASQLALEKKQKEATDPQMYNYFNRTEYDQGLTSPAQAISQPPLVGVAGEMIMNNDQTDE